MSDSCSIEWASPHVIAVMCRAVLTRPERLRARAGSGKAFDDLDDFFAPEAVVAGEFEELLGPGEYGAALGGASHGDASPAAELQQPFLSEQVQRPQDGVLVHAEHGSEVLGQGQPLTRACLAVGDGAADLRGDLVVQRCRAGAVDVDIQHGSSDSSSMLRVRQGLDASSLIAPPGSPVPRGWYLPGGDGTAELGYSGLATANGVIVQS